MSDNSEVNSDTEIDVKAHKRLLDSIEGMQKTQHIQKPKRNESSHKKSEFNLVKSFFKNADDDDETKSNKKLKQLAPGKVSLIDLIDVLKKKKSNKLIGKQLKTIVKRTKLLKKPLEKPAAERIERSIGYEKTKSQLDRWNAIVTKNRATDHLVISKMN